MLALVGIASLSPASGQPPAPPVIGAEAPPQTKDRVPPEQMEAMVAGPLALVREGRRAEADAAFNALLGAARARGSKVRAADLLTAYGVGLYMEGDADAPDDTRRAAIPWLEQAVAATREAWGPKHPETALALQDLADVLRKISPDSPPPEAERALREALAIRRETLGPGNGETLVTMAALADVLAAGPLPPARYAEARGLYEAAIAGFGRAGVINPLAETVNARVGLAVLDARVGRTAEALAELGAAIRQYRSALQAEGAIVACLDLAKGRDRLVKQLEGKGLPDAARAAREAFDGDGSRCLLGRG